MIMQRIPTAFILIGSMALVMGCTTKDVDVPQLAGPSTLAYSISVTADPDTLTQDGVSTARITIDARDPFGQPITGRRLRAQILVDNVPQDYGTLSTKTPTTGSSVTYTAPPASSLAAGQVAQTVTISVIPIDQGDFVNEFSRSVDIRLIPQGVILPTNPNLTASFTVTPPSPPAFTVVTFDASETKNGTGACLNACSYTWNFGDGTSGSGMLTTHQYRTVGVFQASLTVTDARGAQATLTKSITVTPATPPTAVTISVSPSGSASVNQDLFFTGRATPAPGRTIARYDWSFGDGESSSGAATTHRYRTTGSFVVNLVVTDDVGAEARANPTTIVVGAGTPTGSLSFLPTAPRVGLPVSFNASTIQPATGATIVSYRFDYGDGNPAETGPTAFQSHVYSAPGSYVASVTVTDNLGRTSTSVVTVPVIP
jgi:PKD repeat protein